MGENGPLLVVEVELGQRQGEVEVGLVEVPDGPDVAPVSVEKIPIHLVVSDGLRNDLSPEVLEFRPVEKSLEHMDIEKIAARGGEMRCSLGLWPQAAEDIRRNPQALQVGGRFRLLHKRCDS